MKSYLTFEPESKWSWSPLIPRSSESLRPTSRASITHWNIAELAGVLHKPEDRALFLKRAANNRNLYRADKSLMWPKDDQGSWIEPMDPKFGGGLGGREFYDENNA